MIERVHAREVRQDHLGHRGFEWVDVEMPDKPKVIVVRDEAGTIQDLLCPTCDMTDSLIAEVDQSTRWNRLDIVDGLIYGILADGDHQHIGYVCENCRTELDGDFDVEDYS